MSNTHNNYEAAAATATAARGETKADWYKRPFLLNAVIASGVILVALIINANFQFNLFWKLLLGAALIWGGGKLGNAKVAPVTLWGKILGGLGWAIVVIALLNSGVRLASESMVNWVDKTLTELSGKEVKVGGQVTGGDLVKVEFPKIKGEIGQAVATGGYESAYQVTYPPGPPNTMKVWDVCIMVTKPEVVTAALFFDRSPGGKTVQTIRFADRTKEVLMRQGRLSQGIEVTFNYVLVPMGTKDVCAAYQQKVLVDLAK